MMRKPYIFLLLFSFIQSYAIAQYKEETPEYQPRSYYFHPVFLQTIDKEQVARQIDSIMAVTKIDSLYQLHYLLDVDKNRYVGFELDFGWQFGDMSAINDELGQLGFDPLKDNMFSFGFGFPFKSHKVIHSYILNVSGTNESEKDDVTISASKASFKALVGYNLTSRVQGVDLFPFAGLALGGTNVYFNKNDWKDIDYPDLNTLSSSFNSSAISRTDMDYILGFQLDSFAGGSSDGAGLGIRIAYSQPMLSSKWKREGEKISYTNNMKMGTISFTLILKAVGNMQSKSKAKD